MLKILYLCDRKIYETKMSRVRFHTIDAIGQITNLTMSGPGWDGFENVSQIEESVMPDLIIWYKPLNIPGYKDARAPRCLQYNEMHDFNATKDEIEKSGSKFIICHHLNDIDNYNTVDAKFINIQHCADIRFFKDYQQKKDIDVLLVGVLNDYIYPLRTKLVNVIQSLQQQNFVTSLYTHPTYTITNAFNNNHIIDFAKHINRSKITLTCSSKFRYLLGKYIEIPMCNSLLVADMPDDQVQFLNEFIVEIDITMSINKIVEKITYYLEHDEERCLRSQKGYNTMLSTHTQQHYANKFVDVAKKFLNSSVL